MAHGPGVSEPCSKTNLVFFTKQFKTKEKKKKQGLAAVPQVTCYQPNIEHRTDREFKMLISLCLLWQKKKTTTCSCIFCQTSLCPTTQCLRVKKILIHLVKINGPSQWYASCRPLSVEIPDLLSQLVHVCTHALLTGFHFHVSWSWWSSTCNELKKKFRREFHFFSCWC